MHIIISIRGWIAPPDKYIVAILPCENHRQVKQKLVYLFVKISLSYQIFDFNAEGVGQCGDRANGDVLGLNLAGLDLANLPGVDARQFCKLGLGHAFGCADVVKLTHGHTALVPDVCGDVVIKLLFGIGNGLLPVIVIDDFFKSLFADDGLLDKFFPATIMHL